MVEYTFKCFSRLDDGSLVLIREGTVDNLIILDELDHLTKSELLNIEVEYAKHISKEVDYYSVRNDLINVYE